MYFLKAALTIVLLKNKKWNIKYSINISFVFRAKRCAQKTFCQILSKLTMCVTALLYIDKVLCTNAYSPTLFLVSHDDKLVTMSGGNRTKT